MPYDAARVSALTKCGASVHSQGRADLDDGGSDLLVRGLGLLLGRVGARAGMNVLGGGLPGNAG